MDLLTNPTLLPFLQLMLAVLLGMSMGIERGLAGRTAGPRTYGLVSLGACLLTIMSLNASALYPDLKGIDPMHLLASIISGVGFLGAGLIIFKDSKVSGLTTAAGIWVSAAIGIAVGLRFYLLSLFTTFITLFIFTVMWKFENKIKDLYRGTESTDSE